MKSRWREEDEGRGRKRGERPSRCQKRTLKKLAVFGSVFHWVGEGQFFGIGAMGGL